MGAERVCKREKATSYRLQLPQPRKDHERFSKKKRVPWREEGSREEGEAKKKTDQVVPGGVPEGGGQATATPPTQGRGSILP